MITSLVIFIAVYSAIISLIAGFVKRRFECVKVEPHWYAVTFRYQIGLESICDIQERLRRHRQLHVLWFGLGIKLALILMVVTSIILFKNIIQLVYEFNRPPSTLIVPVVPGLTVPLWQIGYIWISVIIAICAHELGHFLCAILYDIPVHDIGLTLSVLPMAFVSLDSEALQARPSWVRRSVASAGILHNIAVALVASALLFALPIYLYPFYQTCLYPIVRSCSSSSPLNPSIINGVTEIQAINSISLSNANSLIPTLQTIISGSDGICISDRIIDYSNNECCTSSSPELCMSTSSQHQFCIQSKSQLPRYSILCDTNQACTLQDYPTCSYLQDRNSRIVYITTQSSTLIFVGNPAELSITLELADYVGRSSFIPISIPLWIERLLKAIIFINISLALVNSGPVFGFDGEHLVQTWACTPIRYRRIRGLLGLGTVLLITNVIAAVSIQFIQSILV